MTKGYRPNVGMMIINRDKKVLMCTRIHSENQPYRLQMPQGGIDKGEKPFQAVYREMWEEIGLRSEDVRFMATTKYWYKYDLPETVRRHNTIRGQRQKWFLFLMVSPDEKINLKADKYQEFTNFEWIELAQVADLVVPFKKTVYEQVIEEFRPFIERLKID